MKLSLVSMVVIGFLIATFNAAASLGTSSDANGPSISPLYDYRYNQVVEELGVLEKGASQSKLSYDSIKTANLNPENKCKGTSCRSTIKNADPGALDTLNCRKQDEPIGQTVYETCSSWPTCSSTCGGTCSNTCGDTCGGTCGNTCGDTCSGTCGGTCADTCDSTCGNTCLYSCQTCVLSCGADTCGSTCGSTCSSTCGSTCGGTCGSTCGSTCASTCGNTCLYSCQTCVLSCGADTCGRTCASTCQSTCGGTCGRTCMSTCAKTCFMTCSATCGPKCPTKPAAIPASVALANYSIKTPSAAKQNVLLPYNIIAYPPESVYHMGIYAPWAVFDQAFSGDKPLAWIDTDNGWDVAATMPQGTWVREFIYIPSNRELKSSVIAPTGLISNRIFDSVIPGYKYIWFYAEMPGTYISAFQTGGLQSNSVAIYVF
ncbi:Uncharacterised protein [uncultured archaeon]|nr:Uncharacterised protein [uncultured archaeon]